MAGTALPLLYGLHRLVGGASGSGSGFVARAMRSATPDTPNTPPVAPRMLSPEAQQAAARQAAQLQAERAMAAPGRQSTLLTGAAGLSTPAPTQRKTLLGA